MWKQGKNEHGIDNYFIQNGSSTICKVKVGENTFWELWYEGKQYPRFTTSDEAKQKYEELTKGLT